MKSKTIIIIMMLICAVANASGQIQNSFFGATFGKSDMNTVYNRMTRYFGRSPVYFAGIITLTNANYAGYEWDAINAYSHNGLFSSICFRYYDKGSSQQYLNRYNSLINELNVKYAKNRNVQITKPSDKWVSKTQYYDGRNIIVVELRKERQNNQIINIEVRLIYGDMVLSNQPVRSRINNDL